MTSHSVLGHARIAFENTPGVARYVQLANFIRYRIAANELPPGTNLPSVQELAEQAGVARVTVRHAYGILVQEGLISSERGHGTRVKGMPAQRDDGVRAAINDWLETPKGFRIRILEVEHDVGLPSSLRLAGTPAASYVRLRKQHLQDRQILLVANFFVASDAYARLPSGSEKEHKITTLLATHCPEQMHSVRQVLTVYQADSELVALLQCGFGDPVVNAKRCITEKSGRICYAAETQYRGEMFVFDTTLPVKVMYADASAAARRIAQPPRQRASKSNAHASRIPVRSRRRGNSRKAV